MEDDIIVGFVIVWGRIRDIWQILYLFLQRFVLWLSLCSHSLPNLQVMYFTTLKASLALNLLVRRHAVHLFWVLRITVKDRVDLESSPPLPPSSLSLSFFPWNLRIIISSDSFPGYPGLSGSSEETNTAHFMCLFNFKVHWPTKLSRAIKLLC